MTNDFWQVGDEIADTKAPAGPIEQKWDGAKFQYKLVNPANKRKYTVLVVGSGLAGRRNAGLIRKHAFTGWGTEANVAVATTRGEIQ